MQERWKDLRVERGLTLEQFAEQPHLSKSALGSYEGDNLKDISHYALIALAKFYEVTVDYLLGRSQTRNHPNADLANLHLSDDMIELLKSGLVDNSLLCELATHPDFSRLMAGLEIYVNGVAGKQVQSANAIVDAVSAEETASPDSDPETGGDGVYLQAAQIELLEVIRGRKEVAETDCTEVRLAEKSKATAGEKISGRQKQILQNGGYHEERR